MHYCRQFSAKQKERQVEIAARILQEEDRMKKRMQQQPYLYDDPKREQSKVSIMDSSQEGTV